MRIACLRVRDLPLAAELRARPELVGRPVAVASGPGPRAELVAVSPEAQRAGVRRLASVTHARALCGALQVCVASPALEHAARAALLDAALSTAPRAELAPRAAGAWAGEAAVFLHAGGVRPLFASEAGFATALAERAARLGLPGSVTVAASRSVALIAARSLRGGDAVRVLEPGSEAAFLAPLPVDILDPDDFLAEAFTRFGVHCVRDLLALPRRALAARLGPGVLALVAAARGAQSEPPLPVPSGAHLVEAVDLEHPVDRLEPLAFALQGVLSRLLARLALRHLACGDFALGLALAGGGRDARRIGVAAPTRDRRVLLRLACRALEADPPRAAIESLCVEVEGRPVASDQLDLFRPAGPAPAALDPALAELEALCGDGRVGAPRVADDHHPDAFGVQRFRPHAATDTVPAEPAGARRVLAMRTLRPPVRAEVRLERGLPARIRSAAANGRVVRAAGPWRTTGAWWSDERRFAFDHFDVQTADGTVARLRFDHVRRLWTVDAVYD